MLSLLLPKKMPKYFQLKRQQRSRRSHTSSPHANEIGMPSFSTLQLFCCTIFFSNDLWKIICCCCLVAELCPTFLLWLHELQPARLPCPSVSPRVCTTHVHWVGDAIQPSHPLLPASAPDLNLSQHQGLSQCVSSLHQAAKVLEFQLQHQSFQWIFRTDFL